MAGAIKVDGKWIQPSDQTTETSSNKIKTAEEYKEAEEYRFMKKLPIKTVTAQDFDIKKWFDQKTGALIKEGYTMQKQADGSYIIKAKPKTYESYYEKRKKKGDETRYDRKNSTYIPHEIYFDTNGNILKEIFRADYETYYNHNERNDGKGYTRTEKRSVYDKEIKEYDSDGKLKAVRNYNDYETEDRDDTDGDRRKERAVYLQKETIFSSGKPTKYNEWDTYKYKDYRYEDKDEKETYKTYKKKEIDFVAEEGKQWSEPDTKRRDEYKAKQEAEKRQEQFEQAYSKAETNAEKEAVLKRYGATVSIETPDGKKYSSSNLDWLENKYKEAWESTEGNKYYSINTGKEVDLGKVDQYSEDRFAYNKVTGATIDKYKQQSVSPQSIAYESPTFNSTNFLNKNYSTDYTPQNTSYYTDIAIERNLIKDPNAKVIAKPQGTYEAYVDNRNWFQKGVDWLDYQAGQVLGYNNNKMDTGLFGGYSPVIDTSKQQEEFKKGYDFLTPPTYQGDSGVLKFLEKTGNVLSTPQKIGMGTLGVIYGGASDLSKGLKEVVFDQIRYDLLKIPKFETEYEKELKQKQEKLKENFAKIESENNKIITELSNIEKTGNFNQSYYDKQEKLIANNEILRTESIDYLKTAQSNPTISKNDYAELQNKINVIEGKEETEKTNWYGFLPQDNYSRYLNPSWAGAGAFALKGAEGLYEFFSQPINWHPYGAMANIGGQTVMTGGENLVDMGKAIATDPAGAIRDIYLINKAYGLPRTIRNTFGKKYEYIEGRGKVPKEFQAEFKAYQKAFEKVVKSRDIQNLNWKTIESLKGLKPKELEVIKAIYKKNPSAFISGSTLAETMKIKPKRASKDLDTFVPDTKVQTFIQNAERMLKQAGIKYTKKGDSIYFKNGEAISVHPYSMMIPNIARSQPFWRMQSQYKRKTPEGVNIARPEAQVYNKITDAFRYNKNADVKLITERPDLAGKTLQGRMPRYPKDVAWGDYVLREMLKQDLIRAQNYPPIIKQIAQYRAGQGLEWIKPYKAKGMVEEATAKPYYYTGKTPKISAGLKYVDFGKVPKMNKKGQLYSFTDPVSMLAYQLSKYDYAPIRNYAKGQIASIKYPVLPTYSMNTYLPPNVLQYGEMYPTQYTPYSGTQTQTYPTDYKKPTVPNDYYVPSFNPNYPTYEPQQSYTPQYPTYEPLSYYYPTQEQIRIPVVTEEPEPEEKTFKYRKEEEKKKFHKQKKRYKTRLSRLQDPYFRILGKSKYSMDLNKLLRDRYGNIYT